MLSLEKNISLVWVCVLFAATLHAQTQPEDKSLRPSPPAKVRAALPNGTIINIEYSQPSLRGRTMGKDVEPFKNKVWRAGANEATVFTVTKPVVIEGKPLQAGSYALFMIMRDNAWTIIFNKKWDQWGAFNYNEDDDALRVQVLPSVYPLLIERLSYLISKEGKVSLVWGTTEVAFSVR